MKCRPLRIRQFDALCDEMRPEHSGPLFHLNIRWLMRKDAGVGPTHWHRCVIKRTKS